MFAIKWRLCCKIVVWVDTAIGIMCAAAGEAKQIFNALERKAKPIAKKRNGKKEKEKEIGNKQRKEKKRLLFH